MRGTLRACPGKTFADGAEATGVWAYLKPNLDTAHAQRFKYLTVEAPPGTFTFTGGFFDDPIIR